jgi:hypothetical protein
MNEFNPEIRIVAVGDALIAISFDSCSEQDVSRAARVVHQNRNFDEMSIVVDGFANDPNTELGDRKPYRGRVLLRVKPGIAAGSAAPAADDAAAPAESTDLVLAEPTLWLDAIGRDRKRGAGACIFPSSDSVLSFVRQGACNAFSEALEEFFSREAYVDTARRAHVATAGTPPAYFHDASASSGNASVRGLASRRPPRAAESPAKRQARFKRQIAFAVVGTPVVVIALMWFVGARHSDPIREAVAQQVLQSKESRESQVELTKQTLKEMGLDPGRSNDIGCLAPQK